MNCDHDWMRMGSREVCLKCNKARMRKDLPAWEIKHSQVVRKSEEQAEKPIKPLTLQTK